MAGWMILAAVLILIAVILIRTFLFQPREQPSVQAESVEVERDRVVRDMVAMIQCRTVSYRDESLVDRAEFGKFETLLQERFPLVHEMCTLEKVGKTGLLYYLKGKSQEKPSVCMAHYDVVPVEENGWSKPAFDGIVENNVIWGRGTLDTKGTVLGIFEAAEKLLGEGYQPLNDLYFAFSGEEEIDGDTCADIVTLLEQRGVKPAFVLDEGGAVVEHAFPGVKEECALIGIGEKGSVNMNFSIESEGGHASTPPVHTILGQLSAAVTKLESHPFHCQFTKPVTEMLDLLGRHSGFLYRMLFANLWCFGPVLDLLCKKTGGELNAMLRTTVAVTRMEGSKAYNVLPPNASFGINMRLLGTDTIDSATRYLNRIMKNDKIRPELVNGMNPSIYSDTSCEEWDKLRQAVRMTWPKALVSPYLMLACSDSRHYCRITDRVYRFSAMRLSKEERSMIHGNDERVPIDTLVTTVQFYVRLLKLL